MVTAVPLPSWKDLGVALAGADAPLDDILARPWRPAGWHGAWYSRGAFALRAIARRRHATRVGFTPVLWLPDYFCNQSTAPLRADGVRLVFYPLSESLTADWATPVPADEPPPDLVMAVHHFGRPSEMAGAVGFARGAGAILIEDAAHALVPGDGIGAAGDFVLFSPRKTLAIPDGAVLIASEAEVRALTIDPRGSAPVASPWLVKRAIQKIWPAFLATAWTRARLSDFDADPLFADLPETPTLSRAARSLIARAAARLEAEAAARRRNWDLLAELFADRDDARPFWTSWSYAAAAPYRFVLRARDYGTARRIHERLGNHGIPVETWPDLAPEVMARPERHYGAISLRRTVLLLPVHAGMDCGALAERIRRALR